MNARINGVIAGVILIVVVLAMAGILLRQLPTHSEEAKGHVEAVEGLVSGLKESLPVIEPIIQANSRAAAWAGQKPSGGKVTVSQDEVKAVVKQLAATQDSLTKTRAS